MVTNGYISNVSNVNLNYCFYSFTLLSLVNLHFLLCLLPTASPITMTNTTTAITLRKSGIITDANASRCIMS